MLNMQTRQQAHIRTDPLLSTAAKPSLPRPKLIHIHPHPSLDLKSRVASQSTGQLGGQPWQFLQNRRESQLNAMFNRRKTMLETISRRNKTIYQRICNQEGHYAAQKLGKEQFRHDSQRETITLAQRSKVLLSMSRQALVNSLSRPLERAQDRGKNEKHCQAIIEEKENMYLPEQNSRFLRPVNKGEFNALGAQKEVKIVESRYLGSTSRTINGPALEVVKPRACSVDRRKTCEIYVNF